MENNVATAPVNQQNNQPVATNATLYVGDLDPDVTEATLHEIFNQIAPVLSVKVCRDLNTRKSLKYAYINFQTTQDAEKAMSKLNYALINRRTCRIMFCQRDPSLRKSGQGNLFVKNLDKDISPVVLLQAFSQFGKILSCKLASDETGRSKGFGFVHFEDEKSAQLAMNSINGRVYSDKKIYVSRFMPKKERLANGKNSVKFNNIYVKNFESWNDDDLMAKFSPFGKIISAVVMKDSNGTSKRFGFVSYDTPSDAENAVTKMNDLDIGGDKKLYVCRAMKKSERSTHLKSYYEQRKYDRAVKYQNSNLYIKNLSDSIDDTRLKDEFSKFGHITSAKIMRDERGVSRGFGFVCFENQQDAQSALNAMSGYYLDQKPLFVGIAQPKETRKQQLALHHAASTMGFHHGQPYLHPGLMLQFQNRFAMPPFASKPNGRNVMPFNPMAPPGSRTPFPYYITQYPMVPQLPQPFKPSRSMGGNSSGQRMPSMYPRGGIGNINGPPQSIRQSLQTQVGMNRALPQRSMQNHDKMYNGYVPSNGPNNNSGHNISEMSSQHSGKQQSNSSMLQSGNNNTSKLSGNSRFDDRQEEVGNILHKYAHEMYPEYANKLVGMILHTKADFGSLLNDPKAIKLNIKEAFKSLQASMSKMTTDTSI